MCDHAREFRDDACALELRQALAIASGVVLKHVLLVDHLDERLRAARDDLAHRHAVEHRGGEDEKSEDERVLVTLLDHREPGVGRLVRGRIGELLRDAAHVPVVVGERPTVARLGDGHRVDCSRDAAPDVLGHVGLGGERKARKELGRAHAGEPLLRLLTHDAKAARLHQSRSRQGLKLTHAQNPHVGVTLEYGPSNGQARGPEEGRLAEEVLRILRNVGHFVERRDPAVEGRHARGRHEGGPQIGDLVVAGVVRPHHEDGARGPLGIGRLRRLQGRDPLDACAHVGEIDVVAARDEKEVDLVAHNSGLQVERRVLVKRHADVCAALARAPEALLKTGRKGLHEARTLSEIEWIGVADAKRAVEVPHDLRGRLDGDGGVLLHARFGRGGACRAE